MDIEKVVAEIANSLGEDSPESAKESLENIKREFSAMQISLKAANEEAKTNRLKANDLRGKLEDADVKIAKLSDDSAMNDLKANYEKQLAELQTNFDQTKTDLEAQNAALLESQKQLNQIFKDEVKTDLEVLKDLPAFEKVKPNLKLPEVKDDKFDFENYPDEDAIFTKEKLAEYKRLGLFGQDTKIDNPAIPKVTDFKDVDIVELAKTNPAEARKVLDAKRNKNPLFS